MRDISHWPLLWRFIFGRFVGENAETFSSKVSLSVSLQTRSAERLSHQIVRVVIRCSYRTILNAPNTSEIIIRQQFDAQQPGDSSARFDIRSVQQTPINVVDTHAQLEKPAPALHRLNEAYLVRIRSETMRAQQCECHRLIEQRRSRRWRVSSGATKRRPFIYQSSVCEDAINNLWSGVQWQAVKKVSVLID